MKRFKGARLAFFAKGARLDFLLLQRDLKFEPGPFNARFVGVICFAPDGGGYLLEKPNFQEANPLVTPPHITPAWYFGAYYAMLRATPSMFSSALPGVIVMFGAVLVLFFVPWLDRHPVRSTRYKGTVSKLLIVIFAADFAMLSYLGMQPASALYTKLSQIGTVVYFAYFASLLFVHKFEKSKPVPERVTG